MVAVVGILALLLCANILVKHAGQVIADLHRYDCKGNCAMNSAPIKDELGFFF